MKHLTLLLVASIAIGLFGNKFFHTINIKDWILIYFIIFIILASINCGEPTEHQNELVDLYEAKEWEEFFTELLQSSKSDLRFLKDRFPQPDPEFLEFLGSLDEQSLSGERKKRYLPLWWLG